MEKQPLSYEEFYDSLWGNIDGNIVSEEYAISHAQFIEALTFDFYRLYEMDADLKITTIRRMVESFFFALFRLNKNE